MIQQQVYIINTILMVLDGICVIAAGYGAFYVKYYWSDGDWTMNNNVFAASVMIVMFLNNYMLGKFHLYDDRKPTSYVQLLWSILKAITISFIILSTGLFIFKQVTYSRAFLILFSTFSFILIVMFRILSQLYFIRFSNGSNMRRILVVGNIERWKFVADLLAKQLSWGHKVVGVLTTQKQNGYSKEVIGTIKELPRVLRNIAIDEVVFALDADRSVDLSIYLNICKKMGISARILPALWEPGLQTLSMEKCQEVPFLTIRVDNFNATGLLYKRILDLVGGLVGTILYLIMWPFVAVAIKLDSSGPILFKQKRVGRHGRPFNLCKFRSMYKNADEAKIDLLKMNEMNGAIFKLKDDPRITRVGKWLRNTSLDEFPQFLNVLKGNMSLVGTRPPTPDEVKIYQPWHLKRISAKPGITGLWQISGRNKIRDFDKVVELDCKYLDNWRFSDDIKILFKTIIVVLQRKGAL